MDRRKFLKLTALTGAGLSMPWGRDLLAGPAEAAAQPDLVVAHGASPAEIVKAAIDALGGMGKFISRGDVVVIKPNIGWDRTPEQAGNTNPEVVAAIVRLCFEAGAKKVRVFDRPVNDPRRCYVQSQIEPMAQKAGADVSHIDDRKFKEVAIPKGEAIKSHTKTLQRRGFLQEKSAVLHARSGCWQTAALLPGEKGWGILTIFRQCSK